MAINVAHLFDVTHSNGSRNARNWYSKLYYESLASKFSPLV